LEKLLRETTLALQRYAMSPAGYERNADGPKSEPAGYEAKTFYRAERSSFGQYLSKPLAKRHEP
jgi:hypothetical protein